MALDGTDYSTIFENAKKREQEWSIIDLNYQQYLYNALGDIIFGNLFWEDGTRLNTSDLKQLIDRLRIYSKYSDSDAYPRWIWNLLMAVLYIVKFRDFERAKLYLAKIDLSKDREAKCLVFLHYLFIDAIQGKDVTKLTKKVRKYKQDVSQRTELYKGFKGDLDGLFDLFKMFPSESWYMLFSWMYSTLVGSVVERVKGPVKYVFDTKFLIHVACFRECRVCWKKCATLKICAGCLNGYYCSRKCQKRDWISQHKKECNLSYKRSIKPVWKPVTKKQFFRIMLNQ